MQTIQQRDFSGGMRFDLEPSRLGDTEYAMLVNGRTRYSTVEGIKQPVKETVGLPANGNYQGIYAAGKYALVFIDGQAYIKNFNTDSAWSLIPDLQMSLSAEYIYAIMVPASTINFNRESSGTGGSSDVTLTSIGSSTPQAVVIQDGINQPWLIFPDGTSRRAYNYGQWTTSAREYVPVGKQMAYVNGVLYIVAPNGHTIYRSVTGRPLDFVIPVDSNGDKLAANEADGGASQLSFAVGYETITALANAGSNDGSIMVSSAKNVTIVTPDYSRLIYSEPQFTYTTLLSTGALNQFAITEVLGDIALIGFSGIQSFNSVQQVNVEGKNSPFSQRVYKLFDGVVQATPCATTFDNYALFAMDTVYGNLVVVYDTLRDVYVSLDIFSGLGESPIKMFAELKIDGIRKLLFCTARGLFEGYASTLNERTELFTRSYTTADAGVEIKPEFLNYVARVTETSTMLVELFCDEVSRGYLQRSLAAPTSSQFLQISPYGNKLDDNIVNSGHSVTNLSIVCFTTSFKFSWYGDLSLLNLSLKVNLSVQKVPIHQAIGLSVSPTVYAASGVFEAGEILTLRGTGLRGLAGIIDTATGVDVVIVSIKDDEVVVIVPPDPEVPDVVRKPWTFVFPKPEDVINTYIFPPPPGTGGDPAVVITPLVVPGGGGGGRLLTDSDACTDSGTFEYVGDQARIPYGASHRISFTRADGRPIDYYFQETAAGYVFITWLTSGTGHTPKFYPPINTVIPAGFNGSFEYDGQKFCVIKGDPTVLPTLTCPVNSAVVLTHVFGDPVPTYTIPSLVVTGDATQVDYITVLAGSNIVKQGSVIPFENGLETLNIEYTLTRKDGTTSSCSWTVTIRYRPDPEADSLTIIKYLYEYLDETCESGSPSGENYLVYVYSDDAIKKRWLGLDHDYELEYNYASELYTLKNGATSSAPDTFEAVSLVTGVDACGITEYIYMEPV